jgi:2-dehydropantoate 2-reductase
VQEIGRKLAIDTPMIDAVLALIKLREAVNQGTALADAKRIEPLNLRHQAVGVA